MGGGTSALITTIATIGSVLGKIAGVAGTVAAVSAVDDAFGAPIKDELGLVPDESSPQIEFTSSRKGYEDVNAQTMAEGLKNYLYALRGVVPGQVHRHKAKFERSYIRQVQRDQDEVKDLKEVVKVDNSVGARIGDAINTVNESIRE
jgi:hypothetical protein